MTWTSDGFRVPDAFGPGWDWKSPCSFAQFRIAMAARTASGKVQHLYFIWNPRFGAVKIGKSTNPRSRLSTLQTGAGCPLELLAVITGGGPLERDVHRELGSARLFKEWFAVGPTRRYLREIKENPLFQSLFESQADAD